MNRTSLLYISIICFLLGTTAALAGNVPDKKLKASKADKETEDLTPQYSDEYLDSVKIDKVFVLNDYTSVAFESGVNFNQMRFNPPYVQGWRFVPEYYELSYIRYGKLFGYMPYFGLKLSLVYGHEGYVFKENEETGYIASIYKATECDYKYVEVPIMSHFHADTRHFKVTADVGPYAGYRLSIDRIGEYVDEDMKHTFTEFDRRFDYGLKGGVGMALVFSPIEVFINGKVRYSLNPLFEPDYLSQYYYKYAYPFDVMVTAGVQFQITKRTGKTKTMLRKEAKQTVYDKYHQTPGQSR